MQKLRSVQVLRGVAACGVVLMHAHFFGVPDQTAPHWTQLGSAGVDLFFVISGFIIASIPKRSVGQFAFDRFWRIYPIWWVALLPWLLLVPADWSARGQAIALWPVTNLPALPYLAVRWTLSFELLFYSAVALAMRTGTKLPLFLFGCALVAGAVTQLPAFSFIGSPMILEFLFGVVVARLPRSARTVPLLVAVSVALFTVAPLRLFPAEVALNAAWFRVVLWGFPAAMLLYAAVSADELFKYRAFTPFVVLGDASYSIYLFHMDAINLLHLHWFTEFCAGVSIGVVAWWLLERRLLAFKTVAFSMLGKFTLSRSPPSRPGWLMIAGMRSTKP